MFEALKHHLQEATPIEEIRVNKRKSGGDRPSPHAVKSRESRANSANGVRRLKTLVQEKNIMKQMGIPQLLEWGEYANNSLCIAW